MQTMQNGHQPNGNVKGYQAPSREISPQKIKEPVKLVLQLIYAFLAVLPLVVISVLGYFFHEKKSLKGKTILVSGVRSNMYPRRIRGDLIHE